MVGMVNALLLFPPDGISQSLGKGKYLNMALRDNNKFSS